MEHHIRSLRTEKFVISVLDGLCTASLAAFIDNQPQLKDCCEYFVQLTSTVKGSLLRAIVDSNNHVTLLCKVLARLLNHLGSAQAMQQLTSEVVEAVRVLGLSLNTVCTGFEGDDDTEESAMKISSALEASGAAQALWTPWLAGKGTHQHTHRPQVCQVCVHVFADTGAVNWLKHSSNNFK